MTEDARQLLREHGIQVTAQRPAARLEGSYALGVLSEKGLIRRIQPARSPARYEDRVDDNHHHLVCRHCGRMVDVDCAAGYRPCLEVEDDFGYSIDEAEVVYWGLCPACQKAPAAAGQES